MILVNKDTRDVVLDGEAIKLNESYVEVGGSRYHEFNSRNTEVIDVNIPSGRVEHWKYIDGSFQLTDFGLKHKADMIQKSQQEKIYMLSSSVQEHLDRIARQYRFDDIKSARSQANAEVPQDQDPRLVSAMTNIVNTANALSRWELECWATVLVIEEDVISGAREIPTEEELILELPVFINQ